MDHYAYVFSRSLTYIRMYCVHTYPALGTLTKCRVHTYTHHICFTHTRVAQIVYVHSYFTRTHTHTSISYAYTYSCNIWPAIPMLCTMHMAITQSQLLSRSDCWHTHNPLDLLTTCIYFFDCIRTFHHIHTPTLDMYTASNIRTRNTHAHITYTHPTRMCVWYANIYLCSQPRTYTHITHTHTLHIHTSTRVCAC